MGPLLHWWTIFVHVNCLASTSASVVNAPYFVDDESGHSVPVFVSSRKAREMRAQFVEMFGISTGDVVGDTRNKVYTGLPFNRKPVPKFVMNYFNHIDSNPETEATLFEAGNISAGKIIGFVNKNFEDSRSLLTPRSETFQSDDLGVKYKFELGTNLLPSFPVNFAELRMKYLRRNHDEGNATQKVYIYLQSLIRHSSFQGYISGGAKRTYEKLFYITQWPLSDGDEETWVSLNVTDVLENWIAEAGSNAASLELIIAAYSENATKIDVKSIGLGNVDNDDILLSYFEGEMKLNQVKVKPNNNGRRKRRRQKRSTSSAEFSLDALLAQNEQNNRERENRTRQKAAARNISSLPFDDEGCQVKHMYVDFFTLGLQTQVIAPKVAGVHYCDGRCDFPLTKERNATKHAIVQTMMAQRARSRFIPPVCCVPTHMDRLSFLYLSEPDGNVVLNTYNDIVVKSCGCR